MSRIGKQPILIPEGVEVTIDGQKITIKGSKGELSHILPREIKVTLEQDKVVLSPLVKDKKSRALWGLWRAIVANMVRGVSQGFEKKLELEGVGYRAEIKGEKLILSLGFSHPVEIKIPPGIELKVEKNIISVSGIDKQLVGQVAAQIRSKRKPEPYKGTGIRYQGEVIRKKVGKKAVTAEL